MRRRGQILPIAASLMALIALVFTFFVNVAGYRTTAGIALDSTGHSAGIAGLREVDDGYDYERWFIDPVAADAAARQYAKLVILGETSGYGSGRTGSLASLFDGTVGDLTVDLGRSTADGTRDGIDVEVINPAVNGLDDASYRYLNGATNGTDGGSPSITCGTAGTYPEGVTSVLDGSCYYSSTVVVRLRLTARQLGGGTFTLDRTVAVSFGTNG